MHQMENDHGRRVATSSPQPGLIERLRRTIAAERPLLVHPLFGVGAARVMVRAQAEIRRIERSRLRRA